MRPRRYRAKIEILRDVLAAAKREEKKTRIMGMANLNTTSIDRYLAYCVEHSLLLPQNGGFQLTARAEQTLEAINLVLSKGSQLNEAMGELVRLAGETPWGRGGGPILPPTSLPLEIDAAHPGWLTAAPGDSPASDETSARRRR